ncbi:uncharacterized protein LOC130106942 [Lampris incognitus]|uniref:uncharacterized protein LOC130106942 n=1 Tax=Lampris incognitus TaxID=2546036 RepID=UPI0024B5E140|nr:uncharacterized protein LOC130106942 [Lampris incognitus]
MFRNRSREGHYPVGPTTTSSPPERGVPPSGQKEEESSWISMLSGVSRPALLYLQSFLPGRPRNLALPENVSHWVFGHLKQQYVDEDSSSREDSLNWLSEINPLSQNQTYHLTYLNCQTPAGVNASSDGSASNWLTTDALFEIGIQNAAEMDMDPGQRSRTPSGSAARSFFSHVLNSVSAQEMKHSKGAQVLDGKNWLTDMASSSVNSNGSGWWDRIWGSEETSQTWLSNFPWGKGGVMTNEHCPRPANGTKATVAKTTELFVHCNSRESIPGESAGHSSDKAEPFDNSSLQIAQPECLPSSEGHKLQHQSNISINSLLFTAGATSACIKVSVLTPDQDNGYSSLEEEQSICPCNMVKTPCEEEPQGVSELNEHRTTIKTEMEGDNSELREEGDSITGKGEVESKEEEMEDCHIHGSDNEEGEKASPESPSSAATVLTIPPCRNKAIAFIMGSPCSDDEDSQSDQESSDDDDDGFDSEGSSELSDSVDEDSDESSDSDSETDSETERLWHSLCKNRDPYNPRNFTASIQTSSSAPRTIPTTTSASSVPSVSPCFPQSSPASSPDQTPSPLSSSPGSPPSCTSTLRNHDVWEDSTSASEVDEAESLCLWNSFSSSLDPYSPLNFQATLRTHRSAKVEPGAGDRRKKTYQTLVYTSNHVGVTTSPPQYRKEEADERLDSGFCEPLASTVDTSTVFVKKVRFCEEVEEFFASCGEEEDRRGPWEELARDRCRFRRRCQEVEQSIAYCLDPQHRRLIYEKRTVWNTQDS